MVLGGNPVVSGSGTKDSPQFSTSVWRNGVGYLVIGNGWGPGFQDHTISWNGTAFTVVSMNGVQGPNYEPASYPAVLCGHYGAYKTTAGCGLPAAMTAIKTLRTGWRWKANGNTSNYNSAYDVWLSGADTATLGAYLMVWLRDPPDQQPAGSLQKSGVTVANVPGQWDVWSGMVNGLPIINWVKPEGQDLYELEFDVMDFIRDAANQNFTFPGTHILAVAAGFEIWDGPVTNLVTEDFYVEVKK
jgi:Glycosyl hydrolase family 12